MSLPLREKQSLYHSLGQLVRSGVALDGALQSLAGTASGGQRRLLRALQKELRAGRTIGEAMAVQRPAVGDLEVSLVAAGERSGRLDQGLVQLADYFGALAAAREGMLRKCAYPVFLLHFAILLGGLRTLVVGAGLSAYLRETFGALALIWGLVLVLALLIPLLLEAGAGSAVLDALLRRLPLLGKVRRAFATARFCAAYGMQLGAGINVLDALQAAARASRSGVVRAAVHRAVPEVRAGAQVGPTLTASGAFPAEMMRAFSVGEQTGQLDAELTRLTAEHQAEAFRRLDTVAEWLPRLFYVAILLYVAYGIVTAYQGYLGELGKMIEDS